MGLEGLLKRRAVSLISIEVDTSWPLVPKPWAVSHMDQLCWLGMKHGFTPYFKVPCPARRGLPALLGLDGGESSSYVRLLNSEGRFVPTQHHLPNAMVASWGIQDLLLVDECGRPELQQLQRLGAADCTPLPLIEPLRRSSLHCQQTASAIGWNGAQLRAFA